jgi:tripeptide aminopeptidase
VNAVPDPSPERLEELFLALASIPSPSRSERAVAKVVRAELESLGIDVHEDGAGEKVGGDCGNLYCLVQGDDGPPMLAVGAHLDTVQPTAAIEPYLDGEGVFRNREETILGADDKAAVAVMLHAAELLRGRAEPFPAFELFFTVCEEDGLLGAKQLDAKALTSSLGVVLDSSGPVGGIVVSAPSRKAVSATFRGRAAHAGVEPELGRSAIVAAGKAVAAMKLGRLDAETTANVGLIQGGVATNIVPEVCRIDGECRGHDEDRLAGVAAEMVEAIHVAAAEAGVDVEVELDHEFQAFALDEGSPAVRLAKAAVTASGLEPRLVVAGGGSDANILNARGLPTVNLDAGMTRVHSSQEHIALVDLVSLCRVVLQMIVLAPQFGLGNERASGRA